MVNCLPHFLHILIVIFIVFHLFNDLKHLIKIWYIYFVYRAIYNFSLMTYFLVFVTTTENRKHLKEVLSRFNWITLKSAFLSYLSTPIIEKLVKIAQYYLKNIFQYWMRLCLDIFQGFAQSIYDQKNHIHRQWSY